MTADRMDGNTPPGGQSGGVLRLRLMVKVQACERRFRGSLPPRRLAICTSICAGRLYAPPQTAYVWAPMGNSRRGWVVVGCVVASLVTAATVLASETSEVLTAKGELAYAQ